MIHLSIETLYLVSFLIPLAGTAVLTPAASWVARRLDILDHPADNKHHSEATPYLGGLAVALGLVGVGAFTAGTEGEMLVILLCGLAVAVVGLLDDRMTVPPLVKLLVEVAAGVTLWLVGVRAGLFGVYALDLLLTVVWVVGITNALNFLDNMDGLASGVAAICALTFFVIAATGGQYLVASFALLVAGAALGFLVHNFPPARIFLGDAGSLLLGFLLAAVGLKLRLVGELGIVRSAVPVLALGVPLLDTFLVIVSRIGEGRRVYVGGTDHASHRLAGLGLSSRKVALVHYLAQACSSALALTLLRIQVRWGIVLVAAVGTASVGLLLLLLRLRGRTVTGGSGMRYPDQAVDPPEDGGGGMRGGTGDGSRSERMIGPP